MVVFLDGMRLYMRLPIEADLPDITRWMNNWEVTRNLMRFTPASNEEESEWLKKNNKDTGKGCALTMVLKETDEPIGVMSLFVLDWRSRLGTTGAFIEKSSIGAKGMAQKLKCFSSTMPLLV